MLYDVIKGNEWYTHFFWLLVGVHFLLWTDVIFVDHLIYLGFLFYLHEFEMLYVFLCTLITVYIVCLTLQTGISLARVSGSSIYKKVVLAWWSHPAAHLLSVKAVHCPLLNGRVECCKTKNMKHMANVCEKLHFLVVFNAIYYFHLRCLCFIDWTFDSIESLLLSINLTFIVLCVKLDILSFLWNLNFCRLCESCFLIKFASTYCH